MFRTPLPWICAAALTLLATACVGDIVGSVGVSGQDSNDAGLVAAADAAIDATPPEPVLARDISITDVSIYQTVAILLAENGAPLAQRNAPVIVGAPGVILVNVAVASGWQSRDILAVALLETAQGVRESKLIRTVPTNWDDNPTYSGFAIPVDADVITEDTRYAVELREVESDVPGGSAEDARFPVDDFTDLGAQTSNGPFVLTLVPFRYDYDGSGRLPPMDEATIERYRKEFLASYPVASVEIAVREPVAYSARIGSGSTWSNWLDALTSLREQDAPPENTFYYGIAAPRETFSQFCSGGCTTGLGWVPDRGSEYMRAAVGVSFAGSVSIGTAIHEVGHTAGRFHAPCGGVSSSDSSFPYGGGSIGVWGYDAYAKEFKAPDTHADFMGYCDPAWISDYTYEAIFERIRYVNQAAASAHAPAPPLRYRVALVDESGEPRWRRIATLRRAPTAGALRIARFDRGGAKIDDVTGHFFGYDHQAGGMLLVPLSEVDPGAIQPDGMSKIDW